MSCEQYFYLPKDKNEKFLCMRYALRVCVCAIEPSYACEVCEYWFRIFAFDIVHVRKSNNVLGTVCTKLLSLFYCALCIVPSPMAERKLYAFGKAYPFSRECRHIFTLIAKFCIVNVSYFSIYRYLTAVYHFLNAHFIFLFFEF